MSHQRSNYIIEGIRTVCRFIDWYWSDQSPIPSQTTGYDVIHSAGGLLRLIYLNESETHTNPNQNPDLSLISFEKYEDESAPDNAEQSTICVVCLANRRNIVLQPCGHSCTCIACTKGILSSLDDSHLCPICKRTITGAIHYYRP
jgi:hypothetical protein